MLKQSNPKEVTKRLNKLVFTLTFDNRLILEIIINEYVMKIQNFEESKDSKTSLTESKASFDKIQLEMPDEKLPLMKIFEESKRDVS